MNWHTHKVVILSVLMLLALSGCYSPERIKPGDPSYAPITSLPEAPMPREDGSLFQTNYGLELFADRKALRVGDVITIMLSERTVSQKSSGVAVNKNSDLAFDAGPILGNNPTLKGLGLETAMASDRTFSGDSAADQSNSLEGNITVTVASVLPNGNLEVRGEKWITLNRGDEYLRISGILRPDDINPDNTVDSTRLANARISYSGTGELADSGKMGWLARFFNSPIWPL